MGKTKSLNLGLVLAIALVIASKKLQKHTGVAAADWRRELLEQAMDRFNHWSIERIQQFIADNFGSGIGS